MSPFVRSCPLVAVLCGMACTPEPARVRADTGDNDATTDPGENPGGDDSGTDATLGDAGPPADGGNVTSDGANAADGGASPVTDAQALRGRERLGYVRAQQLPGTGGLARGQAGFLEWSFDPDAGTEGCVHGQSADDACQIERCPTEGLTATGRWRNAGPIEIAGEGSRLLLGADTVTRRYDDVTDPDGMVVFAPGTMVSVSAAGSDVGGFNTDALLFPSPIALASPVAPSGGARLAIDRTQPLALTVNNASANANDTLFVRFTQAPGRTDADGGTVADPTQASLTIECSYLVLDGSGLAVSPDVLAELDANTLARPARMTVGSRVERAPLVVGGSWTVRVQLENVSLETDLDVH